MGLDTPLRQANIRVRMPHLFPGFSGIVLGFALFAVVWLIAWVRTDIGPFKMDAQGVKGDFEKLLAFYQRCGELLVGIASVSIVLLISSSAFKQGGLPWRFASSLFLLALSVIYVSLFMVLMTLDYEHYRHQSNSYTRFKYTRNQALGFASVLCFCAGYLWLIIVVTEYSGS